MNIALRFIDFYALSPLLIVLFTSLVVLLLESFSTAYAKKYTFYITISGIILSILAAFYAPSSDSILLTPWLRFDAVARFFTLLFLGIGLASACLAYSFFKRFEASHGEYYFLLLSSLFGLILVGASADFLTLFLGIETLSISLYVLCGYMKKWEISQEASIKYFLIGALATAFLIYGIALIYGAVGHTGFATLLEDYQKLASGSSTALFLGGIALITVGLAFKAAVVPFHVWAPDVYEGAPTPVTAFMAVGTKAGAFAAFVVVFLFALPQFNSVWNQAISFLAYPTLIYANIVALRQTQLRRFFAYSGISNAGFLLIPLAAGTPEALSALMYYLIVYSFATLGCFAVLSALDQKEHGVLVHDLEGLFHRSPFLASVLALCLLTLAGLPPTAGFFAKFYIFKTAFQAGYYGLVIAGLLVTILSVFYYLRLVTKMLSGEREKVTPLLKTWPAILVGTFSIAAIVILSFYPMPLLDILSTLKI